MYFWNCNTATLQHFYPQPTGYQQKKFIVYGHDVTANYTFLSPSRHNPGKNRPKFSAVLPSIWLQNSLKSPLLSPQYSPKPP